ncbi:hypothetical protein PflCFBP13517_12510 [Pseudomonas fluorescens]|nr:hypothetical protein PflCFBP13517_12510 [Pseudomonas fluorescens]
MKKNRNKCGSKGPCGSWLACDADNSVLASDRGDAIAGKPAPTESPAPTGILHWPALPGQQHLGPPLPP